MGTKAKEPTEPRPSASILLFSPSNEILLLHRVKTSTSFPAAHVFPGGNLSSGQDGEIPDPDDPRRHQDGPAYRLGAIRECFEESGILLALCNDGSNTFLEVPEAERERARKEIHAGKLQFSDWVTSWGGVVDSDSLIPFTRWITPTNIPRRFTTQMYIAFLPLSYPNMSDSTGTPNLATKSKNVVPAPTSDGIEHTAVQFLPCIDWLSLARANQIILFVPQFYLIHLLCQIMAASVSSPSATLPMSELQKQRDAVLDFVKHNEDGSGIKWADKVMSPYGLLFRDGRNVLALDKAGTELDGSGRGGDRNRVVLVRFTEEGPRDVEVRLRKDVIAEVHTEGKKDK